MNQWNHQFRLYLQQHLTMYVFVFVLFVMGVLFGSLLVNALSIEQKEEMFRYLSSFFHTMDQNHDINRWELFLQSYSTHLKWLVLIWLLGLSIIGLPLILILDFLKGVLVGFTVGFLTGQLSWKGMLYASATVVPQNLIIIPSLMITSVTAIAFSIYIIKHRFIQKDGKLYQPFMTYTFIIFMMGLVLVGASLLETFLTPLLMKSVTPMVLTLK